MSDIWTNHAITSQQAKAFEEWAETSTIGNCENCGAREWLANGIQSLPVHQQTWNPWIDPYGLSVSVVFCWCQKCANTRLFVAKAIGVVPKERSGPLPPRPPEVKSINSSKGEQVFSLNFQLNPGQSESIGGYGVLPVVVKMADNFEVASAPREFLRFNTNDGVFSVEILSLPPAPNRIPFESSLDVESTAPNGQVSDLKISTSGLISYLGEFDQVSRKVVEVQLSQYCRPKEVENASSV